MNGFQNFLQRHGPGLLAARHGVELILHRGREAVFDVAVKVLREEAADDLADVRRGEAPVVDLHVFSRSRSVEMIEA